MASQTIPMSMFSENMFSENMFFENMFSSSMDEEVFESSRFPGIKFSVRDKTAPLVLSEDDSNEEEYPLQDGESSWEDDTDDDTDTDIYLPIKRQKKARKVSPEVITARIKRIAKETRVKESRRSKKREIITSEHILRDTLEHLEDEGQDGKDGKDGKDRLETPIIDPLEKSINWFIDRLGAMDDIPSVGTPCSIMDDFSPSGDFSTDLYVGDADLYRGIGIDECNCEDFKEILQPGYEGPPYIQCNCGIRCGFCSKMNTSYNVVCWDRWAEVCDCTKEWICLECNQFPDKIPGSTKPAMEYMECKCGRVHMLCKEQAKWSEETHSWECECISLCEVCDQVRDKTVCGKKCHCSFICKHGCAEKSLHPEPIDCIVSPNSFSDCPCASPVKWEWGHNSPTQNNGMRSFYSISKDVVTHRPLNTLEQPKLSRQVGEYVNQSSLVQRIRKGGLKITPPKHIPMRPRDGFQLTMPVAGKFSGPKKRADHHLQYMHAWAGLFSLENNKLVNGKFKCSACGLVKNEKDNIHFCFKVRPWGATHPQVWVTPK